MRTPHVHIHGTASHLPPLVALTDAVEQGLCPQEHQELHNLVSVAVAGETPAPELALRAARKAYERADPAPEEVGLLLYADSWHQGPDGWQPQYYLQRHLVGGDTLAVELRHGCNGVFSALELASAHLAVENGPRTAMVVTADNFGTPLFDRWRAGPGYVAGDGAAALVLGTEPGFARLLAVRSDTLPDFEELHRGTGPLFPPGPTVGRALDFATLGERFRDRMLTGEVDPATMLHVQRHTVETVHKVLDEAGIKLEDVTRVAYMNYGREIVEQRCMAALDLPMERSVWDLGATLGHMGASDQTVALDHLVATGAVGPGDHVLMLGVGPGVTISAAVVGITTAAPWAGDRPRDS